jgi:hypothetical protein
MPQKLMIRNEDISQVVLAAPEGHRHLRLAVSTKGGDTVVLSEAAVAAIVRAYTAIKTHPVRRAVKLASTPLAERKKGYAEHQLLEVDAPDETVVKEITALLDGQAR